MEALALPALVYFGAHVALRKPRADASKPRRKAQLDTISRPFENGSEVITNPRKRMGDVIGHGTELGLAPGDLSDQTEAQLGLPKGRLPARPTLKLGNGQDPFEKPGKQPDVRRFVDHGTPAHGASADAEAERREARRRAQPVCALVIPARLRPVADTPLPADPGVVRVRPIQPHKCFEAMPISEGASAVPDLAQYVAYDAQLELQRLATVSSEPGDSAKANAAYMRARSLVAGA